MNFQPLMFMGQIQAFEKEGTDHVLTRLWDGGIRELVLGDLILSAGDVRGPAFAPNRDHYDGLSEPPELPEALRASAVIFRDAVKQAADRGFKLYLHDWGQFAWFQPGSSLNDPQQLQYGLARTRDTYEQFPELNGFILDGPEYGYEIEPDHRSDVFAGLEPADEDKARQLGYDVEALRAAPERLRAALQSLGPAGMRGFIETQGGFFDATDMLLQGPELFDLLRFRIDCIQDFVGAFRDCVKQLGADLELACGPRTSAFAPLTGYNYRRLLEVTDFFCPKLYFWQHGIDGLKGTVYRYAKTMMEWNEGVDESLALRFTERLFDISLPGVASLDDLSQPLSPEFFRETVPAEIDKMIYRSGGAEPLRPWLGLHHGGVRISPQELEQLLEAVATSGLLSMIYWHYSDMSEEEWRLLQKHITT
jgi:hypothetical protein